MTPKQALGMIKRANANTGYWRIWLGPVRIDITVLEPPAPNYLDSYYGFYSVLKVSGVPMTQESGTLAFSELLEWLIKEGGQVEEWEFQHRQEQP